MPHQRRAWCLLHRQQFTERAAVASFSSRTPNSAVRASVLQVQQQLATTASHAVNTSTTNRTCHVPGTLRTGYSIDLLLYSYSLSTGVSTLHRSRNGGHENHIMETYHRTNTSTKTKHDIIWKQRSNPIRTRQPSTDAYVKLRREINACRASAIGLRPSKSTKSRPSIPSIKQHPYVYTRYQYIIRDSDKKICSPLTVVEHASNSHTHAYVQGGNQGARASKTTPAAQDPHPEYVAQWAP